MREIYAPLSVVVARCRLESKGDDKEFLERIQEETGKVKLESVAGLTDEEIVAAIRHEHDQDRRGFDRILIHNV